MLRVSFFTAVLANDATSWRAKDVDVEDCSNLDDLAELMREVAHGDNPVLAIIEREDGWFAIARVDGDEPPTAFVSDLPSALEGHYAELLGPAGDLDADVPPGVRARERQSVAPVADEDELSPDQLAHDAEAEQSLTEALGGGALLQPEPDGEPTDDWAGDPNLLADLGVPAAELVSLVTENQDDPATALAEIGAIVGFADLVESLR